MKKISLSILFLFALVSSNLLAIEVSGNQSGTWSAANNPYEITGDITVPSGDLLQVEPGVEAYSQGNYKITVLGYVLANGSQADSILFTTDVGTASWGGIRLENETEQSSFSYCYISNTDDINDYGIQAVASPVTIQNCTLDNHKKAVSFSGLSTDDPPYMEMSDSKILNCEQNGIIIIDNSNALVDNCEFTQCGLGAQYRGAIQLSLQSSAHNCSPTLTNNDIHNNGKQGIILGNMFNYDEMAPTVENNEVYNNLTGIYLYNAKGTYHQNHIHDNYIPNDPNSGAGFMIYGSGAYGIFTENHVHHNYTGFFIDEGASSNLGNLNNGTNTDDGWNMIHDNVFFDGTVFSVVNNSSEDIMAENNVWDHIASHDSTIVDGNDDSAYGIVDHEPYLPPFPAPDSSCCYYENGEITFIEPSAPTYVSIDSVFVEITAFGYTNFWWLQFTPNCTLLLDMLAPATYTAEVAYLYETGNLSSSFFFDFVLPQSASINPENNFTTISPNPFLKTTKISLAQQSTTYDVAIEIYNIKGQRVKCLPVSQSQSQKIFALWDGKDSNGVEQKSGIYFCKIQSKNQIIYRKLIKW
ncbi:MAG: right-handed parallel beta-helix repeat-containing protein [Candidatus Cloacimonetes bacterium]|nr:right-handed parallel beta-helix repeat-containing protein [Candidatus Cloacimonadota bacterium]MBS3766876.1 right-handed parallel beta-helix repeat-containing protein [Candidatus Cloacimonadota bacterium]